jgi:hypothetical protein
MLLTAGRETPRTGAEGREDVVRNQLAYIKAQAFAERWNSGINTNWLVAPEMNANRDFAFIKNQFCRKYSQPKCALDLPRQAWYRVPGYTQDLRP